MKILEIHIDNFGKFKNYSYKFDEKLNIIDEPNGFGKTTIAQFIKSMIYGMPNKSTSQRTNNRRFKYSPWDSSKYGGKLIFKYLDNTYTITREFGESKTGDKFSLYDNKRKVEINKFSGVDINGNNFGDVLIGVSESSFEKTNFIEQSEVIYFDSNEQLHSDINTSLRALFGGTKEDNNYQKAQSKLTDAIRDLAPGTQRRNSRYNKNEDKINELNSLVNESIAAAKKITENEEQLLKYNEEKLKTENKRKSVDDKLKLINKKNELTIQLENYNKLTHNKIKQEENLAQALKIFNNVEPLNINLETLENTKDEYIKKEENLTEFKNQKQAKIDNYDVKIKDLDSANTRKIIIEHEQVKIQEDINKTNKTINDLTGQIKQFNFLDIILSIITLSIYYFIVKTKNNKIKANIDKENNELEKLNEEYQSNIDKLTVINNENDKSSYLTKIKSLKAEILEEENIFNDFKEQALKLYNKFSVSLNNLALAYHQIETNYNNYLEAKKEIKEIESELTKYNKQQIETELQTFVNLDEITLKKEKEDLENLNDDIIKKINTLEREIEDNSTLANNLDLYETELEDLRGLRQDYEQKRSLLKTASTFLEEANQILAAKYLIPLQGSVNKLIEKFELEDYKVRFDGNSKMTIKEKNIKSYKDFGFYSTGYQDLMSVIVRVALIEIIYKDIKPFIIFDDSFVNFDDNRIKLVKPLLNKLKEDYQIIYFTCSKSRNLK